MRTLPSHDRRQEPAHDLAGLTKAEIACLADLAGGRLRRFPKGYALCDALGDRANRNTHSARVVWSLQDKGLLHIVVIVAPGTNDRIATLPPGDGTVAWIARSAARKMGR